MRIRRSIARAAPLLALCAVPLRAQDVLSTRPDDAALVRGVVQALDSAAAAGAFSGVVLVAREGRPVVHAARGAANREQGIANTLDTRFQLGSGDKLFTRLAIGQLLAAGRLSLHDTVGRFLPDYPDETIRRRATVDHLLRHSSGLGAYWNDAFQRERERLRTLQDVVALFAHEPPAFQPGARMQYSNSGYILLGRIVEVLSGESYYDYVRRHLLEPGGMRSTAYLTLDEWRERAIGYTALASWEAMAAGGGSAAPQTTFLPNRWALPYRGNSAGGGYATAEDLLRLDTALRAGRLVPPEVLPRLFSRPPDAAGRLMLANGGGPGANFEFHRVGDYTIIVLANQDPPAGSRMFQTIARLLPQQASP
jgi:CubicO group peptidase (beta-lactamase class C family)